MTTMGETTEQKINERLTDLRREGKTIVEAIKHMVNEFGLDLARAKQVVSSHESWQSTVRAAQPLHADVEIMAKRHKT